MDRFNEVGVIDTSPAFDRTAGWQMAFAKDIEGFRQLVEGNRPYFPQIERAIDLRTRGMNAANREAARAEAIRWQEEQAQTGRN
ncbi:MAG: hypothetical protein O2821_13255 [Chloroflexi bacterium]|nr:hypothetical protein [Chloroflexota bacterium]MDA1229055.1 hypothetical protein [Chloroflexota bacterium]